MNFDISAGAMMAGMLVSSIGCGFFVYGKKQSRAPQLLGGIAMLVLPALFASPLAILASGGAAVLGVTLAVRAGA